MSLAAKLLSLLEKEDKVEKKISSVVNSILIPIYLTIIIWGITLMGMCGNSSEGLIDHFTFDY